MTGEFTVATELKEASWGRIYELSADVIGAAAFDWTKPLQLRIAFRDDGSHELVGRVYEPAMSATEGNQ